MNREEAVLRELNLYPLWRLREGNGGAIGHPAAHQRHAGDIQSPAALESLSQSPLRGQRDTVASTAVQAVEIVEPKVETASNKSREQLISELNWPELKAMVRDCTACKLRAGCTQTVFGTGDEKADWLFVGEGPGADEDAQGEPFVGQAGKLLDNMLAAIKLKRGNNVYIANIVKCRPPGNRAPEADEIATCLPYLQRQIALIQPKIIVALGKTAATSLLGRDATLGSLRSKLHDYRGIPLIITYHPAYLLRSPMEKAKTWQDLCLAVETMQKA
ncbi:MAG: uracil-DNA glycosylase [Betaproteobacteria bacterium]|nr:uracil-DNA glycosylase [Betaproteobacteria bacterium]